MVRTHRGRTQYGVETTYGTAVTADKVFGFNTEFTGNVEGTLVNFKEGDRIDNTKYETAKYEVTCDVTFAPSTGDFLEYIFGYKSGTGTSTDPYIFKTYDSANSAVQVDAFSVPSLTIEDTRYDTAGTATATVYTGCKMKSAEINVTQKEIVKVSASFIGQSYTSGSTPSTAVSPSLNPFVANNITHTIGSFSGNIDNFKINITREYDQLPDMQSLTHSGLASKMFTANLNATMTYEDDEFVDDIKSKTTETVSIKIAYDANRYIKFDGTLYIKSTNLKKSPDGSFMLQDIQGELIDLVATVSNQ